MTKRKIFIKKPITKVEWVLILIALAVLAHLIWNMIHGT